MKKTKSKALIRTAAEHESALAHVATLMGAPPGSAAESELEVWARAIERYEQVHHPIAKPVGDDIQVAHRRVLD
jgi:hypothetical protein